MFEGAKQCTYDVLMLSKALYCRYAQAYDAQDVDQNNCSGVLRRVCPVAEGLPVLLTVEGHWQRSCKWGCFAYVAKSCAGKKIFAGCCSSVICNWMAARCLAVWEALTKALQLGFYRFYLVSRRMEEFYLGKKKVPWQLAALIDGQKCKEVGEHQWCTYMLCIGVTAEARALATLTSNSFNIFWLVTLLLDSSYACNH